MTDGRYTGGLVRYDPATDRRVRGEGERGMTKKANAKQIDGWVLRNRLHKNDIDYRTFRATKEGTEMVKRREIEPISNTAFKERYEIVKATLVIGEW